MTGWTLLLSIIITSTGPYFFCLVGCYANLFPLHVKHHVPIHDVCSLPLFDFFATEFACCFRITRQMMMGFDFTVSSDEADWIW